MNFIGKSLLKNEIKIDKETENYNKLEMQINYLREKELAIAKYLSILPFDENKKNEKLIELEKISEQKSALEKQLIDSKLRNDIDLYSNNLYKERRKRISKLMKKNLEKDGKKKNENKFKKEFFGYEGFWISIDFINDIRRMFKYSYIIIELWDFENEQKIHDNLSTKKFKLKKNDNNLDIFNDEDNEIEEEKVNNLEIFKENENEIDEILYFNNIIEAFSFVNYNCNDNYYFILKFISLEKIPVYNEKEFDNIKNLPPKIPELKYVEKEILHGWTIFNVFYNKILIQGNWKLPLIKSPFPETIFDQKDVKNYIRNELTPLIFGNLYIRIGIGDLREEEDFIENRLLINKTSKYYEIFDWLKHFEKRPELDELEIKIKKINEERKMKHQAALHKLKINNYLENREREIKSYIKKEEGIKRKKKIEEQEEILYKNLAELKRKYLNQIRELEDRINELQGLFLNAEQANKESLENIKLFDEKIYKGIRVKLFSIKKFDKYKYIKVICGLFLDDKLLFDDLGYRLSFESEKILEHVPDDIKKRKKKPNPFNLKFKDSVFEFFKNVQGLSYIYKRYKKLYLGFQIILNEPQKIEIKVNPEENEEINEIQEQINEIKFEEQKSELYGWILYELTSVNGKINIGVKNEYLNKPPLVKLPLKKKIFFEKLNCSLKFKIEVLDYDFMSLPYIAEKRYKKKPKKDKLKLGEEFNKKNLKDYFILNKKIQWKDKEFNKGMGIDIYIDSCRFLPDNITVTRLILRVLDNEFKDIITPQQGRAEIKEGSNIYNPIFNFRHELRAPSFDPTIFVLITFITMNSHGDNENSIIGYSFFNLFINKYTEEMPYNRSEYSECVLQNGFYQLPIYCQKFPKNIPFHLKNLMKVDRLPCSSVLIKVFEAPTDEKGLKVLSILDVDPKDWKKYNVWVYDIEYSSALFNNSYIDMTENELNLFKIRAERKPINDFDIGLELKNKIGHNVNKESLKNLNDETELIIDFFDTNLKYNQNLPILDLKYFSKYLKKYGFKFAIDSIIKLPKKGFFIILFHINPKLTFYLKENRSTENTQINCHYNWQNSTVDYIQFNETYINFPDVNFHANKHIIIDIREIKIPALGEVKILPIGWTFLPIFNKDGYVNSNIYQLKIFKGEVTQTLIKDLNKSNILESLNNYNNNSNTHLKNTTIVCRLLDAQREGHFNKQMDLDRIKYNFLPQNKIEKLKITNERLIKLKKSKLLEKIIPEKQNCNEYNNKISINSVKRFDLRHYFN